MATNTERGDHRQVSLAPNYKMQHRASRFPRLVAISLALPTVAYSQSVPIGDFRVAALLTSASRSEQGDDGTRLIALGTRSRKPLHARHAADLLVDLIRWYDTSTLELRSEHSLVEPISVGVECGSSLPTVVHVNRSYVVARNRNGAHLAVLDCTTGDVQATGIACTAVFDAISLDGGIRALCKRDGAVVIATMRLGESALVAVDERVFLAGDVRAACFASNQPDAWVGVVASPLECTEKGAEDLVRLDVLVSSDGITMATRKSDVLGFHRLHELRRTNLQRLGTSGFVLGAPLIHEGCGGVFLLETSEDGLHRVVKVASTDWRCDTQDMERGCVGATIGVLNDGDCRSRLLIGRPYTTDTAPALFCYVTEHETVGVETRGGFGAIVGTVLSIDSHSEEKYWHVISTPFDRPVDHIEYRQIGLKNALMRKPVD